MGNVGDRGARGLEIARLAVVATRGGCRRKAGVGQRLLHIVGQRYARGAAGLVVDDDGLAGALVVIEHQRRAELADRRGRVAGAARHLQDGLFVEIVAAEMIVDVAEHRIVFDERRGAAGSRADRITGVDGVAEDAGVAEIVPGRHARRVRHGEGGEQRVRIGEVDALVTDRGHGRRGLRGDFQRPQAVRNEQNDVSGLVILSEGGGRRQRQKPHGKGRDQGAHQNLFSG